MRTRRKPAAPRTAPGRRPVPANDTNDTATANGPENRLPARLPLTPHHVLQLQRMIGNRATARLVGGQPGTAIQRLLGGTHRLPPLPKPSVKRPATPSPGQIVPWSQFNRSILAAARAPVNMGTSRNGTPADDAGSLDSRRDTVLKPLTLAYQAYDAAPSLPNLMKLYHGIEHWRVMYWDHDSLRAVGLRTPGVQAVLDAARHAIEQKVRLETAKNGASSDEDVTATLNTGGKKGKAPKKIGFFDDVGVPIGFYSTLTKAQVKLFKKLYDALSRNKTKAIPVIIAQLTAAQIVGFPIIKGLFLTRFPAATGIENLQKANYVSSAQTKEAAFMSNIRMQNAFSGGYTDQEMNDEVYAGDFADKRQSLEANLGGKTVSKNLTNAELSALVAYTGGEFDTANKTLRGNDGSTPDDPQAKAVVEERRAKNEVIVSALNKLPAYNGIAYRMQNGWADFDAAVKPGGMFADLAFMSASMTVEGAELGGASGGAGAAGALEVYEIIHTKSARKVTILSNLSRETEVLFKPGVRFQVKAIWKHINGKVPRDAPMEAQAILIRNGPTKTQTKAGKTITGSVRVVELVEV